MRIPLAFLFLLPVFSGAQTAKRFNQGFNKEQIKQHVVTLSSDSFQGRKPFTAGETKTIAYLTTQLKNIGIEPGNGNIYLQNVEIVRTYYLSPVINVQSSAGGAVLKNLEDYAVHTSGGDTIVSLEHTPVVFVGYGIVAAEHKRNDYAGVDVKGKVVLAVLNEGNQKESLLIKGKPLTRYETPQYKLEEAARRGAKACFLISLDNIIPLKLIQSGFSDEKLDVSPNEHSEAICLVNGVMNRDAIKKMFAISGLDTGLLAQLNNTGFKAFDTDLQFSTDIRIKNEYQTTHNVIGKITGSAYPEETIIFSAHWDHLGIGRPDKKGDSIYNGANDNALGVAVVLELARAFTQLKKKPSRTIVFIFFSVEEMGMMGSQWYVQHAIYPLEKTVANFNIDGFNRYGRTKDVEVNGAGNSSLEDDLLKELKKKGRYITVSDPAQNFYFRSDQVSFARAGVPALFLGRGTDYLNGGKNYEKTIKEKYWAYHTPDDEMNDGWRFDGTVEDMELIFTLGRQLANNRVWPAWKPGSAFRR